MQNRTLLHEDLRHLLSGWSANPAATVAQKRRWPQDRELQADQLGKDDPHCLRLLVEDGHDGNPVGSVTAETVNRYFLETAEHAWPADRDLVRFGLFFHLGLHQTLAMVLKGQWERNSVQNSMEPSWRTEKSLIGSLREELEKTGAFQSEFNPGMNSTADESELFRLFEEHGRQASDAGYDEESFRILVSHMLLLRIHHFAAGSREMVEFVRKQEAQGELFRNAATTDRDEYWARKCAWIELENEIGDLLLKREHQIFLNRKVNQKWMAAFGHIYIPLVEEEYRYHSLLRLIRHKEADPLLCWEDLANMEAEERRDQEECLKKLKRELAAAREPGDFGPGGKPVAETALAEYENDCKNLLRQIWRYTHPDRVAGEQFTTEQKRKLRQYYEESLPYRDAVMAGDEDLALGVRPVKVLAGILDKVKRIWENMGLQTNESAVIQGRDLQEQLAWLEERISSLQEEGRQIRAEILAMANDPDLREKQACLATAAKTSEVLTLLEEKLLWYRENIPLLEIRLGRLFESDPNGRKNL